MTTLALQALHLHPHAAAEGEVCRRCHKAPSKLWSIRGLDGRYCESCLDILTDNIRNDRDTISGYLAEKHGADARGRMHR